MIILSSRSSPAFRLLAAVILPRRRLRRRVPPPPPHTPPYLNPISTFRFLSTTSSSSSSSSGGASATSAAAAADLVLSSAHWSETLERELKNSDLLSSHESVIYISRELSKFPEKSCDFFNWIIQRPDFNPSPYLCGSVLRNFATLKAMPQFWSTLSTLRDRGYSVDKDTYLQILTILKSSKISSHASIYFTKFYNSLAANQASDEISQKISSIILHSDDDIKNSEKKILQICPNFSDDMVMRVLRDLKSHPSKVLAFFEWVGSGPNYAHGGLTHNAVVRVLSRGRSLGPFWSMVEKMRGFGHHMDIDTYIKISRHFQKVKMLEDSVKLYEMMMDGPYKPSARECVFLLRAISGTPDPNLDLASRVVVKYEASGRALTKATLDGLHRAMTSVGRFDEAGRVVEAMRRVGYRPDNVTHSQTVYGLCKAGRLEEAVGVVNGMRRDGCRPDLMTWTVLIQGCCRQGDLERALLCLAKMDCEADGDLLDVLVEAFIERGRVGGARTMFAEMVGRVRVRPWQHTYKRLIEALLGKGMLEEALGLLKLMKRYNYPPYPEPFYRYISKHGTAADAREFLASMSVKGYASLRAYEQMFRSFLEEGRHAEAKDLLFACPHHVRANADISKLFGGVVGRVVGPEVPPEPLILIPSALSVHPQSA